ncbi:alpha/beta hydrolase family esterase [Vallicoccus soli]|uniref:Polyhydroxybutyrate depolymerase n=1 Tax=Vallicoccus soli TaxID=2339232 RepID=A0A3A3Z425_9ACTN|nr:PHB depolymerase family esterase [Vallicoccus soli]RJK95297.1 polyhydroxybutyrate depolymerase [Vallicoccus soli]
MPHRPRTLAAAAAAVLAAGLAVPAAAPALAAGGTAGASTGADGCTRPGWTGDRTLQVAFGGASYPVLVHVPAGADRHERLPVVLDLHGSSSNGPTQADISDLRDVADAHGFLAVAPTAAIPLAPADPPDPDGAWAWNVPGVPTTAGQFPPPGARDDVAYLERVLDVVQRRLCGDPDRSYATGFSGGGRMASALACRIPDRIAAVAPVAGLRAGRPDPDDVSVPEVEDCTPGRAVPVITFHGQQDQVNPYGGSPDLRWGYAVPVAVQAWARIDGCRRGPVATQLSEHVTRFAYDRCRDGARVVLHRISDGGHTWPGTDAALPGLGLVSQEVHASRTMWRFLSRFSL